MQSCVMQNVSNKYYFRYESLVLPNLPHFLYYQEIQGFGIHFFECEKKDYTHAVCRKTI